METIAQGVDQNGNTKAWLTEQHSSGCTLFALATWKDSGELKLIHSSSCLRAFITFELASLCSYTSFNNAVRGKATAPPWHTHEKFLHPEHVLFVLTDQPASFYFTAEEKAERERAVGKTSWSRGGVCRDWLSSRTLEWIKSHTGHFGKSVSLGK